LIYGRGKYGVVKLCSHKKTGQKYAAKYVRKLRGSRGVSMVDIKRELQIMNHVKGGQFLMELFDAFEDPTFVIFVVDLISGGELFEHLARMDCLTEEQTVIFTGQMLDALDSLHSANIVHLDVKPENLMLRDQKKEELVLIDFGLARQLGNGEVRCMHGTPEFVGENLTLGKRGA
jgi:serine/threonine protein kinase